MISKTGFDEIEADTYGSFVFLTARKKK